MKFDKAELGQVLAASSAARSKYPDRKNAVFLSAVSSRAPLWLLGVCVPRGKKLLGIIINLELQVSTRRRKHGLRSLARKDRAVRPIYFSRAVQSATKLSRPAVSA
jgi:hypothetical protein